MEEAARAEMHPASTSIERRTFARWAQHGSPQQGGLISTVHKHTQGTTSSTSLPGPVASCTWFCCCTPAACRALHSPRTPLPPSSTPCRVFPDGMSVLKKFAKKVKLQEACFRDVVILYRQAVSDKGVSRVLPGTAAAAWRVGRVLGVADEARSAAGHLGLGLGLG